MMSKSHHDRIGDMESTYTANYKPTRVLPPMKFHQTPAFEPHGGSCGLLPALPHVHQQTLHKEQAFGLKLGTKLGLPRSRYQAPKPIIQTPSPKQTMYCPLLPKGIPHVHKLTAIREQLPRLRADMLDALCHQLRWTTTTKSVTEESKIPYRPKTPPHSTYEENADMVTFRPQRYEAIAGDWQVVGDSWDMIQRRPRVEVAKDIHMQEREAEEEKEKEEQDRPKTGKNKRKKNPDSLTLEEQIAQLLKMNNLASALERPIPGYAGFVPMNPVHPRLERLPVMPAMMSVMKVSYRPHHADYLLQEFAHKGPLSKCVTLTSPYNPFNKITEEVL